MIKRIKYLYWYIKSWLYYPKLKKWASKQNLPLPFPTRNDYAKCRAKYRKLTAEKLCDCFADAFQCDVDWRSEFDKEPITKE